MELEIIGAGEATDPQLGSCSVLVQGASSLLVDCGYGVPYFLLPRLTDTNSLDAVYITHFHADHTFGLPILLLHLHQLNRTKPLVIVGQPGIAAFTKQLVTLAYPNLYTNLSMPLEFVETITECNIGTLSLRFAPTIHGVSNYAVRIADSSSAVVVSGDGELTESSRALCSDVSVLLHESFALDTPMPGHSSVRDIVNFAASLPNLKTLCLMHIRKEERAAVAAALPTLSKQLAATLLMPQPGTTISV